MEYTFQEDLIGKYLSGELNAGEKAELMAWVDADPQNREVFEEMIQLWSITETELAEPSFPVNLPKAWATLDNRLDMGEDTLTLAKPVVSPLQPEPIVRPLNQPKSRSLSWAWSAAAAIAVLLVAAWWVFLRDTQPKTLAFSTVDNQSRSITLPDQSKIVLNENSTLSYSFDGQNRQVELSGEAFFDVAKDPAHPFIIESGDVVTKVLGTSFNIRAYPDESKVKVSVKTGRVEVRKLQKAAPPLVLLPGNSGVYSADESTLEKAPDVAAEDVDSWQQGTLVFSAGVTLAEVIPAIEKFYDIQIQADAEIMNSTISGARFSHKMSALDALNLITLPIGRKPILDNGVYVITQ